MTTVVSIDGPQAQKAPTIGALLAPGAGAVRRYWRPFVLLQAAVFLLVVTYFNSLMVQRFCERLSRWHDEGGLIFSALAAAIAGGLLPEVAKSIVPTGMGKREPRLGIGEEETVSEKRSNNAVALKTTRLNDVTFAFFAFALNGIITEVQFRVIGLIFGYDGSLTTSVKKVLFDQFVTSTIYGTVYWAVIYRWRALGYSLPRLVREMLGRGASVRWYLQHVGPLLIPGWCFWIPMDALVYSMPKGLQLCLFCVVLAAWSLLMVFIATRVEET